MINVTRRQFVVAVGALSTSACTGGIDRDQGAVIDENVAAAIESMASELPFTRELINKSSGILVIPGIHDASFLFGGAYGEGALLVDLVPVSYYSYTTGSFGLKLGYQSVTKVFFFLDAESLRRFRGQDGWTLGANLEYAIIDTTDTFDINSVAHRKSVYSLTVTQSGFLLGASVEGGKFSRIVR